jgi:hypothetical protein
MQMPRVLHAKIGFSICSITYGVNCRPEFGAGFCLLQIVHPQKRRDARNALEACIGRLLEIKGVSHVNQMNLMLAIICSTKNVPLWNPNRIGTQ